VPRAIDRTTQQFVASVKEAVPDADVTVQRSFAKYGRSNYVYINIGFYPYLKVRISDHPIGMRRALYGEESLFIHHLAKPSSWAIWVSKLPALNQQKSRVHA
jgi:hypothetical protein